VADTVQARAAQDGTNRPASAARQAIALGLIALAALVAALTSSILVPLLSQIAISLHASSSATEWVLTSTLLVAAVSVPVFGRLGDLYGKKRMLVVAMVTLVLGSLVSAFTNNITVMIVGRSIVGLSLAAIPLGISLIGTILPPGKAGQGIALISSMLGIGGALGLPLAGLVAEDSNYHALFWICAAGGVIAIAGIIPLVAEPPRLATGSFDIVGTVLLAVTLMALLVPLSEAGAWAWADPRTVGLLAGFAVLAVVFVAVERRIASPVIDTRVNARPALLLTNIASVCVGFALFATLIGTANYVEAPRASGYGFGLSIVGSGLCMVPGGLMMLLMSPVSARLSARFGPKRTLALGAAIVAVGFLWRIALTAKLWDVVVGSALAGTGTGIAYAAMPSLILLAAPRSELAAANGLNSLARSVGSSLASAIGGTILAGSLIAVGGYALPSLAAYRVLFAISAGSAVVGAILALLVPPASPQALRCKAPLAGSGGTCSESDGGSARGGKSSGPNLSFRLS
jgi:MFS family permease